jgi:hypothetical protein
MARQALETDGRHQVTTTTIAAVTMRWRKGVKVERVPRTMAI